MSSLGPPTWSIAQCCCPLVPGRYRPGQHPLPALPPRNWSDVPPGGARADGRLTEDWSCSDQGRIPKQRGAAVIDVPHGSPSGVTCPLLYRKKKPLTCILSFAAPSPHPKVLLISVMCRKPADENRGK